MAQTPKICKPFQGKVLPDDLVSFGPVYAANTTRFLEQAKQDAWRHVLNKSGHVQPNLLDHYRRQIESIENEVAVAYENQPIGAEFQEMMVKDGCLLLHVIIIFLGGSSQLGYDPDDNFFGENVQEQFIQRWIKSMLFVGNQIPFVVLKKLIQMEFFAGVIGNMKLMRLGTDLLETALYGLLSKPVARQEPKDLIHSLQLLVHGTSNARIVGQPSQMYGGNQNIPYDNTLKIPSVKDLSEMGIKIEKEAKINESVGIHFETDWISSTLYLPMFKSDPTTQLILESLVEYENFAPQDRSTRVISYLMFMSELVRNPADAKLLHDRGVIDHDVWQRNELPKVLIELLSTTTTGSSYQGAQIATGTSHQNAHSSTISTGTSQPATGTSQGAQITNTGSSYQNGQISPKFLHLRLQIREYSTKKWPKWLQFLPMGILLSIVQTVIAILTYRQGQNKCVCSYQPPFSPPQN